MKSQLYDYAKSFFKNGNFNKRLLTKASNTEFISTNIFSIQLASSDNLSIKNTEALALKKNISLVNFTECENYLRAKGYIEKDEVISFSKTELNPTIQEILENESNTKRNNTNTTTLNMTKSSSTAFSLYTQNGKELNIGLCRDIPTKFSINLKNLDQLDMKSYDEISKLGSNMYDKETPFYNDLCIPLRSDQKEAVINDRRENYGNTTGGCKGDCIMKKINSSSGYMDCYCKNYEANQEIYPEFGKTFIDTFNKTNIHIAKCVYVVFKWVRVLK